MGHLPSHFSHSRPTAAAAGQGAMGQHGRSKGCDPSAAFHTGVRDWAGTAAHRCPAACGT